MATLTLHTATTAEQVVRLVSTGANVERENKFKKKPFFWACEKGNLPVVMALHEVCSTRETGIWCGNFEAVLYFINDHYRVSLSPIDIAAKNGHFYVVEFLISKGYNYDNVLFFAAMHGRIDIIRFLFQLELPPNVNRMFLNKNHTPLNIACAGGEYDTINELLNQGAIVDEESVYIACKASISIDDVILCSILKSLVCQGANVKLASQKTYWYSDSWITFSKNILHILAKNCKYTSLDFLIDMGGDITIVDNDGGSILEFLLDQKIPNLELMQKLITNGADVNYKERRLLKIIFALGVL